MILYVWNVKFNVLYMCPCREHWFVCLIRQMELWCMSCAEVPTMPVYIGQYILVSIYWSVYIGQYLLVSFHSPRCISFVGLVGRKVIMWFRAYQPSYRSWSLFHVEVPWSLSLSLIPGQGGGSPPQSVPGSPRGVVGPCWTVLPARCPFWLLLLA